MSETADTPASGPETGLGATNGTSGQSGATVGLNAATGDYADLRAAAEAATPGPWYWRSNTQSVYLFGERTRVVMAFERMGMQSAQPAFRGEDGLLHAAGRENINRFADAAYIAAANPARILALLDEREALSNVLSAVGMEATRLLGDSLEQQKRAERAEAALARVEALVEDCCDCGNESCTEWAWGKAIRAALSGETEEDR